MIAQLRERWPWLLVYPAGIVLLGSAGVGFWGGVVVLIVTRVIAGVLVALWEDLG